MQETWIQSLGQEGPMEEEMATHFNILAWEIPQTKEPSELQSGYMLSCFSSVRLSDCSPSGFTVHGILQARILENFLLQGIFLTQGSNPHLLRLLCWQAGS